MARKGKKDKDKKVMTVKYHEDLEEIKKNMTVKLQKKKEGAYRILPCKRPL